MPFHARGRAPGGAAEQGMSAILPALYPSRSACDESAVNAWNALFCRSDEEHEPAELTLWNQSIAELEVAHGPPEATIRPQAWLSYD